MIIPNTNFSINSKIQALLFPGEPRWSDNRITYNFMPSLPIAYISGNALEAISIDGVNTSDGFSPFTSSQETAAEKALQLWSGVANINFIRVEDKALQLADVIQIPLVKPALEAIGKWDDFANALDRYLGNYIGFPIVEGADLRFGTNNQGDVSSGYAFPPPDDWLGEFNQIRQNIADFIDDFLAPLDLIGVSGGLNLLKLTSVKLDVYGDIWINNESPNNAPSQIGIEGKDGFHTLMHEIGHAIGLKHPGNYNAGGGGADAPYLPSREDNLRYSIMSYNESKNHWAVDPTTNDSFYVSPSTPMLYDIAAIQDIYGANTDTNSGDTTYSWSNSKHFVLTIWDGDGVDTIDASNQTTNSIINLNQGKFSSIGTLFHTRKPGSDGEFGTSDDILVKESANDRNAKNVAIAYNTIIENAIGGVGHDSIIGNDANNILEGGGGKDTLKGNEGNDFLTGGLEDDTLIGGAGNDSLNGDKGNDFLKSGSEDDLVYAGEGDDTVNPGLGSSDAVYGEEGKDLLILDYSVTDTGIAVVGSGNSSSFYQYDGTSYINYVYHNGFEDFRVRGTAYDDSLGGSHGDDTLIGGAGADTLTSGEGDDLVNAGAGNDIVIDNRNAQDINKLNGGGGIDTLSVDLSRQTKDIVFDSSNPVASQTFTDGTKVANFEIFKDIKTGRGNDLIVQLGELDNNFYAGGGNDTVNPGLGRSDYVNGGKGKDLLILDYSVMDTGEAVVGSGNGSVFYQYDGTSYLNYLSHTGFEQFRVTGTDYDDSLTGGSDSDTLEGGAGADTLKGGNGDDLVNAGAGDDIVIDNRNAQDINQLDGGAGIDTLSVDLSRQTKDIVFDSSNPVASQTFTDGTKVANFEIFKDIKTGRGDDLIVQLAGLKQFL